VKNVRFRNLATTVQEGIARTSLAMLVGASMMIAAPLAEGGDADAFESILETPVTDDSWEFELMLNGWGPWVEITSAGGSDIDIGLDKIVENLHGLAEFGVGARKGKWSFNADILYVDLQDDDFDSLLSEVKIREWLVTPKIGYRAFEGDWGFVDLQLGLRYTWADVKIVGRILGDGFDEDVDGHVFDGLAGFTGEYNLSQRWYLPFMIEAGAGDSDFVFAGYAGLGYRVNECWDVFLTFKYLTYDFASDAPMQDETAYGPMLRATYKF
jgi:hypothetical protein